MEQVTIKTQEINSLKPFEIASYESVERKFIQIYNGIWGNKQGPQIYEREKFHFNKLLMEKPELQQCTPLSLFGCFLDMAVNGLSLDQSGRPQVYLLSRNCKLKTPDGREIWEKRAHLSVTAYGEIYMRQNAGQIKYADNPIIVYEGDEFQVFCDESGYKKVKYAASIPRKSSRPVAAFIRITRIDGSTDVQWMMESDWLRLKGYSERNNRGKANALYESNGGYIDTGFLENKVTKHAFDSYPRLKKGNFTKLETEEEEEQPIDYGVDFDEMQAPAVEEQPTPFGEDRQLEEPAPVQVDVTAADEEEGF